MRLLEEGREEELVSEYECDSKTINGQKNFNIYRKMSEFLSEHFHYKYH